MTGNPLPGNKNGFLSDGKNGDDLDVWVVLSRRWYGQFTVPAMTRAGQNRARELASDDLETDVYAHDQLDLGALVETETTLALPMKPLCREDCRGLCSVCGGNRNVTACACPEPASASRWAPLKGLADRLPR